MEGSRNKQYRHRCTILGQSWQPDCSSQWFFDDLSLLLCYNPECSEYYEYWCCSPVNKHLCQYDNGINVFQFYDNFAGTSLSSKWSSFGYGAPTLTVNNGLTISQTGTNWGGVIAA